MRSRRAFFILSSTTSSSRPTCGVSPPTWRGFPDDQEGEGSIGGLVVDPSVHDALKGVLGEAERNRFVRSAVRYMIEEKEKRASGEH